MRLGQWAESYLIVLYLTFSFLDKNLYAFRLKLEFPLTLMMKVIEEVIHVGRCQSCFFTT